MPETPQSTSSDAPERTKTAPYFGGVHFRQWSIMDFLRHADADIKSDLPALTRDYLASLEAIINNPPDENHKKAAIKLLNKYRNGGDDQVIRTAVSQVPVFHGDQYNVNVDGHGTFNIDKTRKRPPSENPKCPPKRARTGQRATYSAEFKRIWKDMNDSRKWLLPSGRYVEDILYENFRNHPFECAAHSWVIDTSDESVKTCFDEGEWEVIHTKIPLLPELEKWFLDAALGYEKFNTADDLLKHINCTPLFTPEEYDGLNTDERDGRRWLRESISTWCGLSPSDFTRPHLENWYICSFWNHVFDRCMKTVPGSYMSRGETMSSGTSDRWKSYNRDRTKRKLVGHLYDGVLLVDGHELGVAEHSRQYTPTHNHKWVQDTLKVVKALHDMLYTLQSRGVAAPSVDGLQVDGLQVVGIVVAGWHCQNWRMSIAEGYTCLLIGHDVQEVPSDYKRVFLFIELLTTFWLHRGVVKSCKALLDTPSSLTAAQKAQRLINRSRQPTAALKGITIPRSVKTDGSANESSSEGNGNITD